MRQRSNWSLRISKLAETTTSFRILNNDTSKRLVPAWPQIPDYLLFHPAWHLVIQARPLIIHFGLITIKIGGVQWILTDLYQFLLALHVMLLWFRISIRECRIKTEPSVLRIQNIFYTTSSRLCSSLLFNYISWCGFEIFSKINFLKGSKWAPRLILILISFLSLEVGWDANEVFGWLFGRLQ